ncbi:hypothetical protein ABLT50_14650 [Acinetobacter calcoaceticus]|jgi:hypothetical protein|uniref:hypothetical protein n=1 Tax=Acinetobacter TaxID=469 RepID=UPI0032B4C08B
MTDNIISRSTSIDEIINKFNGECLIINCQYSGFLKLGTGLDSAGDVIAVVYEPNELEECIDDKTCIWKITEDDDGYYFKNERDPGNEFYLFRGADRDQGDYTIYGESKWHDDRKKRSQFGLHHKPIEHGAPPVPLSYYIIVSDDSYYGSAYYLKSGVAKDKWGCHQVYATPNMTNDQRDLWFLIPA